MANERRLIDAFTLAEEIESLTITVAGKPARWNDAKHSVLRVLAEQPDVDAVEVVRCKDCKHNVANKEYDPLDVTDYTDIVCDYWMNDGNLADDFCSYGERKDNG